MPAARPNLELMTTLLRAILGDGKSRRKEHGHKE
jgi:hypothetical protein